MALPKTVDDYKKTGFSGYIKLTVVMMVRTRPCKAQARKTQAEAGMLAHKALWPAEELLAMLTAERIEFKGVAPFTRLCW